MNKHYLLIGLIASVVLNALLLYQLVADPNRIKADQSLFDVDADLDLATIKSDGYVVQNQTAPSFIIPTRYHKFTDSVNVAYYVIPGTDVLHVKEIVKFNIAGHDSVAIANWLSGQKAVMVSPMIRLGDGMFKFFVKDQVTGNIVLGKSVGNAVIFNIDIKDSDRLKRSPYRNISLKGVVTTTDVEGREITRRNENGAIATEEE